jgi:transcriptional regulator with XRE-family HTH domain
MGVQAMAPTTLPDCVDEIVDLAELPELLSEGAIIGANVKKARDDRGLSIGDLAAMADVDKGQISRLERGLAPRPSSRTVHRLADALQLTPDNLLGDPGGRVYRDDAPLDAIRAMFMIKPRVATAFRRLAKVADRIDETDVELLDKVSNIIAERHR